MKVLIAGAGIGGLTAALCFERLGWQVSLLERSASLGDIGAGIQISPNGVKVLQQLGVAAELESAGFLPERLEMRLGRSGRSVFSIGLRETAQERWGAPYLHIHRADLIATLADTLTARAPSALRTSSKVREYRQSADAITVTLADGSELSGDLLVGADGIHSIVRSQMLGADAPTFTGNVAWRATVPVARLGDCAPPPSACVWAGPGRHAVTYLLRGGALANVVGVVERTDWDGESWTQCGSRDEALADFAGWHPIVTRLLEKADTHYRWALFDRRPLDKWSDGRATLLGDACHPMLPFLAQGAVMAIEDAWVLAREVTVAAADGDKSPATALQRYFALRHARTAKVQAGARANMKIFHRHSLAAQWATYGPMWLAGRLLPGLVHARQDWLYGYDVRCAPAQ